MATSLDAIETTGGIATPNFFNGRILSAEDLRAMLTADRRHRALLGRALGPGVATGLRVSVPSTWSNVFRRPQVLQPPPGIVRVTAGIAINGKGETIELPIDIDVRVAGHGSVATPPSPGGPVFADCGGTSATSTSSNLFVLTVRPDSLESGSAPADPYLRGESCGPGYVAEGVRFRRVPVDPTFLASSLLVADTPNLGVASPLARNIVSHLFLGSTPWTLFSETATASGVEPGLEQAHALSALEPCEVPLALFYLQGNGVAELDEWAVRRPCRPSVDDATGLPTFTSDLRSAAGVATYLQFQTQLADMLAKNRPLQRARVQPKAGTDFRYLPAAGILPADCIGNPQDLRDFRVRQVPFFSSVKADAWIKADVPVPAARIESIIRDGAQLPPIDLKDSQGVPVTVLVVEESLSKGMPCAAFIAANHPYQDRVNLDLLTDRLSVLEPPSDRPRLAVSLWRRPTVKFIDTRVEIHAQYRVFTNIPGEYLIEARMLTRASRQAKIEALVVDSPRRLEAGSKIVEVAYTLPPDVAESGSSTFAGLKDPSVGLRPQLSPKSAFEFGLEVSGPKNVPEKDRLKHQASFSYDPDA